MSAPSMTMMMNNNNNNKEVQSQEEETMMVMEKKKGIITILESNSNTVSSSLRRTISADMSSKKWLSQNIEVERMHEERNDHEEVVEDEAERERLEIWSSIQRNKKEEQEKSGAFDMWSSIVSIKGKDEISKSLPAYVHPLMKRTKSCLSEKSLEICTESLGSETGSDGLLSSPYPSSSETGEAEEQEKEEKVVIEPVSQEEEKEEKEEEEVEEQKLCNYASVMTTKKASASPTRAFPPPLPTLSHHHQTSPSLHMRPHRDNGRLVLEAVSVPSNNNFNVQRQDGRLVLTFSNHQEEEKEEEEEEEVEEEENDDHVEEEYLGGFEFGENEDFDEEVEGDEVEEEEEYFFGTKSQVSSTGDNSGLIGYESVIEKGPVLSSGVASLALMMNKNKPIELVNRNPKWSKKFNEMNNFDDEDDVNVAQSLPPRPRVARLIPSSPAVAAAAASFNFNAYEYYWRTKSATPKGTSVNLNPIDQENLKNKVVISRDMNKVSSEQLLVLRGKNGDYLVHNLKSCKDSRRSFLFLEPYCIATS